MEVVVKMQGSSTGNNTASHAQEEAETLMLGRFVMVCRDSTTHKARKVPPLLVETDEEKMLWNIGEGEMVVQGLYLMTRLSTKTESY